MTVAASAADDGTQRHGQHAARPATRRGSGGWWDEREIPAAVSRYVRSGVRSTHEALQYLRRRGVPVRRAVAVVSACQAQGLLDDRAAARLWANHWARQGYAAAAIRLKLADKAFDERDIFEAIRPLRAATAEEERARLVLARDARRRTRGAPRAEPVGRNPASHRVPCSARGERAHGQPVPSRVEGRPWRESKGRPSRAHLARALASRGFDPDLIDRLLAESFGPATPTDPSASCAATSFGTDF